VVEESGHYEGTRGSSVAAGALVRSIDEIRGELAVGATCAGTGSELWEAVEEELLDELTELELILMAYIRQGGQHTLPLAELLRTPYRRSSQNSSSRHLGE
jgi:hypothetical protein